MSFWQILLITTALAKHPFFNNVRYTHIRKILDEDKKELYDILDIHPEIKYRAKIVLLAGEGYTVSEIREMTNTYDKTIRKWIHTDSTIMVPKVSLQK